MKCILLTLATAVAGGPSGGLARRSRHLVPIRVPVARRRGSERGASLVEYALLVALIAIVCIAAVTFLGTTLGSHYSSAADGLG